MLSIYTFQELDTHYIFNYHNYPYRGGEKWKQRELNWPKVTQLSPKQRGYHLYLGHMTPRSGLSALLAWKHERALTLITHFNRIYHRGCHELVITLEGSGAEKGMQEERSGIEGLLREVRLICRGKTGFLSCNTTDIWGQITLCCDAEQHPWPCLLYTSDAADEERLV